MNAKSITRFGLSLAAVLLVSAVLCSAASTYLRPEDSDDNIPSEIDTLEPTPATYDDDDEDDDAREKEILEEIDATDVESRVRGEYPLWMGLREGNGDWHVNPLWLQKNLRHIDDKQKNNEGRLAGFATRLNNHTFIAHSDSCGMAESSAEERQHGWAKQMFSLHPPHEIDIHYGPTDPKTNVTPAQHLGCNYLSALTPDFNVYQYGHRSPEPCGRHTQLFRKHPVLREPIIMRENNPLESHGCLMYHYTTDKKPFNGTDGKRFLQEASVIPLGCGGDDEEENVCRFKFSGGKGRICGRLHDTGAPIRCGDNHLAYLVMSREESECTEEIRALRLAPYRDELERLKKVPLNLGERESFDCYKDERAQTIIDSLNIPAAGRRR